MGQTPAARPCQLREKAAALGPWAALDIHWVIGTTSTLLTLFPLERKYLHMLIEIKIQTYCKKLNRAAARCAMGSLLSVRTEGESKKYSLRGLLPFAHRLCIARNTPTCLPRTI